MAKKIIKIEIKKIGINGEGIGYFQKIPVFVGSVLIDEIVEVEIVEKFPKYYIGKLVNVVKKSKYRINPISKPEYNSGAYPLMILDEKMHKEIKESNLYQSFYKYSNTKIKIDEYSKVNNLFYRNLIKLPFKKVNNKLTLGIYKINSNYFIPVENSFIHEKSLEDIKNKILNILNKYQLEEYNYKKKEGLRTMVLRHLDGKYQLCLITGKDEIPKNVIDELNGIKELISGFQNINITKNTVDIFGKKMIHLFGDKYHSFKLLNYDLKISIRSFFQLNTKQAINMYQKVIDLIPENTNFMVEAYAGIGIMSMLASEKVKEIVGIEINTDATKNGKMNLYDNKIKNVTFKNGDSSEEIKHIAKKKKIDLLLVDPPRTGLDNDIIESIILGKVQNIIYISCNPSTLAKNYNMLSDFYKISKVMVFDMFPWTNHIESVVLLSRI